MTWPFWLFVKLSMAWCFFFPFLPVPQWCSRLKKNLSFQRLDFHGLWWIWETFFGKIHWFSLDKSSIFLAEALLWTDVSLRCRRVRSQTKYLGLSEARDLFIFLVFISSRLPQKFRIGWRRWGISGFCENPDVEHPTSSSWFPCKSPRWVPPWVRAHSSMLQTHFQNF